MAAKTVIPAATVQQTTLLFTATSSAYFGLTHLALNLPPGVLASPLVELHQTIADFTFGRP
jgi:hypothetical protein